MKDCFILYYGKGRVLKVIRRNSKIFPRSIEIYFKIYKELFLVIYDYRLLTKRVFHTKNFL